MTIEQELRITFENTAIGTELTRAQIIDAVVIKFNRNRGSIIPSDYCYNRLNNGIVFEKSLHLFEYTYNKTYIYLGENYRYTGKIYHKPKSCDEICVGEWIDGEIISTQNTTIAENKCEKSSNDIKVVHTTRRDVSVSMRFQVFKRDNFKCCICGASPAKDPSIELHIDHIIPWSKGGETVMDNLQTLCSRCNLGKSDSV